MLQLSKWRQLFTLEDDKPKSKSLDFSSGYYQIPIKEKDRDLFTFLLPQGKYHFARLPKGTKQAGDIFNIISDPELSNMKEIQKNMDDFLLLEEDFKKLDPIIDRSLSICRKRNMKLNPNKFKVGHEVE